MKVSINSLKAFNAKYETTQDIDLSVEELVSKIESQLGAVEEVNDLKDKYNGALIVKVVSVKPHPNADKLTVCLIDDNHKISDIPRNQDGLIQIVCGADNVKENMMAVWLPVGTTIPDTVSKTPLVLEAKEIREQTSYGMLASAKELDLFDQHLGIFEVDSDKDAGQAFDIAYNLKDDIILNLENKMFTHRPDCFGLLGIAREVAGLQNLKFTSPSWYTSNSVNESNDDSLKISLTNELPSLVPRFLIQALKDVSVKSSPAWLQIELGKVDLRPINNVVDISNYIMYLTAQPVHTYDYDKVKQLNGGLEAALVVRNPKPNENITLLNGKNIKPRPEDIMIATGQKLIGLGGVMGGQETEVTENTKNIILECGNFDMYAIRRTAMEHGLFTDAVTRFTKGQSPLQNTAILNKLKSEINSIAGGQEASKIIDFNNLPKELTDRNSLHPPVSLSSGFINERLGLNLPASDMANILSNVEFSVQTSDDQLTINSPFWRTDVELREDVVEEVGRLYGFDKLPLELPSKSINPVFSNRLLESKNIIRQKLSRLGANEVLTYSFVDAKLIEKVDQDSHRAFKVSNAVSPELQYYRLSLIPSLLDKVHLNIKAGFDQFALFELGKTHDLNEWDDLGLPKEFEYLAFVHAINDKLKNNSSSYYQSKNYLETLVNTQLTYKQLDEEIAKFSISSPFEKTRTAKVEIKESGEFLGIIGEFKDKVKNSLKLPFHTSGFEIDLKMLSKYLSSQKYMPLSRFPYVYQDITLQLPSSIIYQEVYDQLSTAINEIKPKNSTTYLTPLSIYIDPKIPDQKNVSFRLKIANYDRTLTDDEVNNLLNSASEKISNDLKSRRI